PAKEPPKAQRYLSGERPSRYAAAYSIHSPDRALKTEYSRYPQFPPSRSPAPARSSMETYRTTSHKASGYVPPKEANRPYTKSSYPDTVSAEASSRRYVR